MHFLVRARATLSARHDRELREELHVHLRLLEEEYTAQGMPADLARQRAHREFGNATRIQEASHDLFSFRLVEELIQDLRYAVREMRRSAGFTCIAVLSLAVAIGAVTATFTLVDAFMLRVLRVHDPERLVVFSTGDSPAWAAWPYASFAQWRSSPDALFEAAASSDVSAHEVPLPAGGKPGEVRVSLVSAHYFRVMGADIELGRSFSHAVIAVRTAGPPADAAAVISYQLGSIAGDLPIEKVHTIGEVLDNAISSERLMSVVSLTLAAVAIALGCVGLYALMAYDVAQRTRELGIRLALGATSRKVAAMVFRDSAALVVPGLAIGVPLGMAAARPLTSQLYGVETGDPWTLASVALLLGAVALLVALRPAHTASRIDPIALLRND
jgi:hypothetical protein